MSSMEDKGTDECASEVEQDNVITIHVAVGSKNPCKVEAVRSAFEKILSIGSQKDGKGAQLIISSFNVESGVSDQPYGDEETKLGARTRAQAAFDSAMNASRNVIENSETESLTLPPDFAVGIEGGVELIEDKSSNKELWCMAWIAIIGSGSKNCTYAKGEDSPYRPSASSPSNYYCSFGKSGSFLLPPEVTKLVVNKGMELGDADDVVFKRVNSKHNEGTVGKLTKGIIDRSGYCSHALTLAFIPWIRPELYFSTQ